MRVSKKVILPVTIILCLLIAYTTDTIGFRISIGSYIDELVSIVLIGIILTNYNKLSKIDIKILFLFAMMILVGVLSNLLSGIDRRLVYIFIDALLLSKTIFCYLGFKLLCKDEKTRKKIINSFTAVSKIMIIILFVFGTISMVKDIGMSNGSRYGIPSYAFIFGQPAHCGLITSFFLGMILLNESWKNNKNKYYLFMGLCTLLYTTKGMSLIIAGVFLILSFVGNGKRLRWYHFVVSIIGGLFILTWQIQKYLMNSSAPRARLLIYGFKVANLYFPLGSGFATYGSEMANRYYSPLYSQIGLSVFDGLSSDYGTYLNDNYMASIMAQFGYIGLIIHIIILGLIFQTIMNTAKCTNKNVLRNYMIAIFACLCSVFIGSGVFKSILGIMLFILLGIYCASNTEEKIGRRRK